MPDENGNRFRCVDYRLPENQQKYFRKFEESPKMLCTNPDDFKSLQSYNIELRTKIKLLEANCNE